MICVSLISCFVSCMSPDRISTLINNAILYLTLDVPVSSRTRIDNHFNRLPSLRVISAARAFIGALITS